MSDWVVIALVFAFCVLYHGSRQAWRARHLWRLRGEVLDAMSRAVGETVGVPAPRTRAGHVFGLTFVVALRTIWRALLWAGVVSLIVLGIEWPAGAPFRA